MATPDTCHNATGLPLTATCQAGPAEPPGEITWYITSKNFSDVYTKETTENCLDSLCTTRSEIYVTTDETGDDGVNITVPSRAYYTLECESTQTFPAGSPRVLKRRGNINK